MEGAEAGVGRGAAGGDTASQYGAAYAIKLFESFLMKHGNAVGDKDFRTLQIRDLTNKMLDDVANLHPAGADAPTAGGSLTSDEARDKDAAQKEKTEDSWFWQTLESSDTLKTYAPKIREYVESPTNTKGAWDWLTSTVPKSAAQLGVGLAKTPFDLAQTFGSGSQAAIEKFLKEHPEYEQLAREDPTGQSLETLGAIGAWVGLRDVGEAAAKGVAAAIGKPFGIDTEKQTWSWDNLKDAWVNHPVESFAAVFPFGAAFLKRKGITPSETQVRELVDSAVKNEKTPLAQELKKEMVEGPPKGELDIQEDSTDAPKSGATFGQATTNDYRPTFFAAHPELEEFKSETIVHHAVEQRVLTMFPGVVTEAEMHSIENLRGVPKGVNTEVHLRQIRIEWNRFYRPFMESGTAPTKAQLLQKATEIDSMFGSRFVPPAGGE